VTNENFILNDYSFADESVARNLAAGTNSRVLLNFDERADATFIPDLAPVQIYESVEANIATQLYIRGDELVNE
jgi:hypothetical protein